MSESLVGEFCESCGCLVRVDLMDVHVALIHPPPPRRWVKEKDQDAVRRVEDGMVLDGLALLPLTVAFGDFTDDQLDAIVKFTKGILA